MKRSELDKIKKVLVTSGESQLVKALGAGVVDPRDVITKHLNNMNAELKRSSGKELIYTMRLEDYIVGKHLRSK